MKTNSKRLLLALAVASMSIYAISTSQSAPPCGNAPQNIGLCKSYQQRNGPVQAPGCNQGNQQVACPANYTPNGNTPDQPCNGEGRYEISFTPEATTNCASVPDLRRCCLDRRDQLCATKIMSGPCLTNSYTITCFKAGATPPSVPLVHRTCVRDANAQVTTTELGNDVAVSVPCDGPA